MDAFIKWPSLFSSFYDWREGLQKYGRDNLNCISLSLSLYIFISFCKHHISLSFLHFFIFICSNCDNLFFVLDCRNARIAFTLFAINDFWNVNTFSDNLTFAQYNQSEKRQQLHVHHKLKLCFTLYPQYLCLAGR